MRAMWVQKGAFLLVWGLLAACDGDVAPDDGADTPAETEDATPSPDPADMVGLWLAEGAAIGEAFQGGDVRLVEVASQFNEDGSYTSDLVFEDGSSMQTSGPYVVDTSTYPWGMVLDQQLPAPEPLEGIVDLGGDVLRLDLISPFVGEPTTPEQGIGGGALGEVTVITMQRQ